MAEHKSQHYVPKVYLRNFSDAAHGKTICLHNIVSGRNVRGAPIKSQCARNYLYGTDDLEHLLGDVESKYADWVGRGILATPPIVTPYVDDFLRLFASIQYMRTAAQIARMQAMMALMTELSNLPPGHELSALSDSSETDVARQNVSHAIEMRNAINDLAACLIYNRTEVPFITCDTPVVVTNRLFCQRRNETNFGVGNAGAILYLPLSPRIALLLYDSNVYSIDKVNRVWVNAVNDNDILKFNCLIFAHAKQNLYMSDLRHFVRADYDSAEKLRLTSWSQGRIMKKMGSDESGEYFAEVEDASEKESYLIGISQRHPLITAWPNLLRFRRNATAFDNQSTTGPMRESTSRMGGWGFRKIRV